MFTLYIHLRLSSRCNGTRRTLVRDCRISFADLHTGFASEIWMSTFVTLCCAACVQNAGRLSVFRRAVCKGKNRRQKNRLLLFLQPRAARLISRGECDSRMETSTDICERWSKFYKSAHTLPRAFGNRWDFDNGARLIAFVWRYISSYSGEARCDEALKILLIASYVTKHMTLSGTMVFCNIQRRLNKLWQGFLFRISLDYCKLFNLETI